MTSTKTLPTMQQVLRYWYTKMTAEDVAARLGVSVTMLYRLRKRYKLPPRDADRRSKQQREVDPPPDEIARISEEIKASWSESEKERRWVGPKTKAWQPPSYQYDCSTNGFSAS